MHPDPEDSVAIIGVAAKFPGARDTAEFWANLCKGRDAVTFPDEAELVAAGVAPELAADPSYVRAYAETPDLELFDAGFFGFTPRDAAVLDPQIRMFLEVAHDVVENAGYDITRIADGVGVFGSTGVNTYLDVHVRGGAGYRTLTAGSMGVSTLSYPDFLATHVAYRFGLRGPAFTVSTACSSSAVATHLACQALRTGECDYAIAGGSEAEIPAHAGYQWDPGGPLSVDGRCRPFDKDASGTIFSTGAGAILLKRLGDALADGDHVYAVIRSSAINNDGATKAGFSAPSVAGQVAAARQALALAGVRPGEVDFVEAHGTGTSLGDPVEVAALAEAYGGPAVERPIALSSVKGNIGHLGHAAGISALVKVALCLANEQRVPTANFTAPNPRLNLPDTPFQVDEALVAWPRDAERPRLAAVNSLGFGGTNAHLILSEAPAPAPAPAPAADPERPPRPQVLLWSAKEPQAVRDYELRFAEHLRRTADAPLADTAATLQSGRTAHPVRGAVVASAADAAAEALESGGVLRSPLPESAPAARVVFAFPGQAAQHPGMAAGLYGADEAFTRALDDVFERFERAAGSDRVRQAWAGADAAELADTALAQPVLFAVEYALARMWRAWGVEPAAVVGHSLGELTAAAVAGVFDLDDAVALVLARAAAMAAMPGGAMAAASAPAERVAPLLTAGVEISAVNGPGQVTLGGPAEALEQTLLALREAGIGTRPIATSHAFHTASMRPAAADFAAAFAGLALREPELPLISATDGEPVAAAALDPEFWAGQLTRPVRFDRALDAVLAEPGTLVLEVGPGQTLTGLVRQHGAEAVAVPTLPRPARTENAPRPDDLRAALSAAATVWTAGQDVDWVAVRGAEPFQRLALPGYQYQRSRYWIDVEPQGSDTSAEKDSGAAVGSTGVTDAAVGGPAAEPAAISPFSTLTWVELPPDELPEPAGDRGPALALLPAGTGTDTDADAALTAVLALQQAGYQPIVARPGPGYQEADGEFTVRPDDEADLDRLLTALEQRGTAPRLLVHGLALPTWTRPTPDGAAEQLTASFHSLAALARAGARRAATAGVAVLAGRSVDVTGAEPVDPVKAVLHGAVRSLALEVPELAWRLIDVALPAAEADLAAELADLLPPAGVPSDSAPGARPAEPAVALRGRSRWARRERPFTARPAAAPVIRRGGTYLITGGLGGLGLAVARAIAGTGMRPHLVLTGRTPLPPDRLAAETAAFARLGATFQSEACDVGDLRAMRRLVDTVRAKRGALHGVAHLAGVAGDGMLLLRGRAEAEAVLHAKVRGTLVLEAVLKDCPPLDFLAFFSSRAALNGLIGSADYASANCFLDAEARLLGRDGVPAVSVGWPSWSEVGMAAREEAAAGAGGADAGAGTGTGGSRSWRTLLDAATDPMLDEHRFGGKPVMPGTGHLDMVVRAFREAVGPAGTPVRLLDAVFAQPLVVERPRRVAVDFEPDGEAWRFTVTSEPADGGEPPVRHASGGIEVLLAERPRADPGIAALRARLTTPMHVDPPTRTKGALFVFGPRWDTIGPVTVGAEGHLEKLIELELPEAFHVELPGFALHPTLLDNATAEARTTGFDAPHVPFSYGVFDVYEDLPAKFTSHILRRPGAPGLVVADIDLYGEDGRLVARIDKYTMRRIEEDGFLPGAPSARAVTYVQPTPTPTPTPALASTSTSGSASGSGSQPAASASSASDPAGPAAEGIDPRTGARMFLALLGARPPHHVAVRPFVEGAPVALESGAELGGPGRTGSGAAAGPVAFVMTAATVVPAASQGAAVPSAAVATQAAAQAAPAPAAPAAPAASVQDRLSALWTRLLGREAGPDADFFDLGGTSLTAVELMAGIREEFGIRIGIVTMFDHPTLAGFAEVLAAQGAS